MLPILRTAIAIGIDGRVYAIIREDGSLTVELDTKITWNRLYGMQYMYSVSHAQLCYSF